MSKVDLNALVNGLSGKLGNAVLRRRGNTTFLISKPKERTAPLSEKEKAHRERFKRATAYAKARLSDPVSKAEYEAYAKQREVLTAFTAAVTDYLKMPVVESLETSLYTGKVNDLIIAKVADDFKVVSVKVAITTMDGALLESGNARYNPATLEWRYVATKDNAVLTGIKITVVAKDRPGNEATLEKVM